MYYKTLYRLLNRRDFLVLSRYYNQGIFYLQISLYSLDSLTLTPFQEKARARRARERAKQKALLKKQQQQEQNEQHNQEVEDENEIRESSFCEPAGGSRVVIGQDQVLVNQENGQDNR